MGCRSILVAVVIAASLLGADASPCKPATSTTVSIIQSETSSIVVSEATSTALVEISLTFSTEATSDALTETTSTAEASSSTVLETTLTTLVETTPTTMLQSSTELVESTPTTLGETTPITTEATTSAVLTEESSTTLAASTTTTEAEACIETQVLANPGFDNDRREWTPWSVYGELVDYQSYSAPNAMRVSIARGGSDIEISQPLFNLKKGKYLLSYRYKAQEAVNDFGFTCSIRPKIGSTSLEASYVDQLSDPFVEGTAEWFNEEEMGFAEFKLVVGCIGNYDELKLHFDDITLAKVCDADLKPKIE